jgi:tripartite-type tricarboxylate transporter receptor subunit TctC
METKTMTFRALALLSLAAASLVAANPATAQPHSSYPSRPITLVVPQAAGGTNDIVGRLVGQKLGEVMNNASVVVDNRPARAATSARRWSPRARRTATRCS